MKKHLIIMGFVSLASVALVMSAPSFIVSKQSDSLGLSRNEVKEDFGNLLHRLVEASSQVQMASGKAIMMLAAMQRAIADQAAALVEDAPPFNNAATTRLSRVNTIMRDQVDEFTDILRKLESLAARVKRTTLLEEEV